MPAGFRVLTTRAFDRSIRRLARKNPDIPVVFERLASVLSTDPLNTSRRHQIKKLTNVEPGGGQWRIRSG